MTTKRMRGRPQGSGIDDSRFLHEIADLLHNNTRMKPTAAMRQVMQARKEWHAASEPAMLRRLQEKWKIQKEALLADAQQRAEARGRSVTLADVIETGARLHAAIRAWQTPENLVNLQRIASNVASMIERITEPVARVQAALAQRPEVLTRIAAVSQQMQQINRIAEPVARVQNAVAIRSDAMLRIAEVSKRIQQANRLPTITVPKV